MEGSPAVKREELRATLTHGRRVIDVNCCSETWAAPGSSLLERGQELGQCYTMVFLFTGTRDVNNL